MAILTTGISSAEANYISGTEGSVMAQTVKLPASKTKITFDYNVISEEPMEYVGSSFDDKFVVQLLDKDNQVLTQAVYETVNSTNWIPISGVNFEWGDDTVYQTGWRNITIDVSPYKNQFVTLRFMVYDVGDSAYDTAAIVDNVVLK